MYDPNFRARLTSVEEAREALREVAPHAALVLPSCPGDTAPLLGTDDADAAVEAVRALGAGAVRGVAAARAGWSSDDRAARCRRPRRPR